MQPKAISHFKMVAKKHMGYDISIDSHSSKINNMRIIERFQEADQLGIAASNNPTIGSIHAYFSILDSIFINVSHVLMANLQPDDKDRLTGYFEEYRYYHMIALKSPTLRIAYAMLDVCKKLNLALVSGLQQFQFFFRMGQRGKKGLKYIDELYGGRYDERESEGEEEADL
jgi:hypothetical protein